jgi:hypothetical protein
VYVIELYTLTKLLDYRDICKGLIMALSPTEVIKAITTLQKAKAFIENKGLYAILEQVADVHFTAAQKELARFDNSVDKKACINRAATTLQTAQVAYEKQLCAGNTIQEGLFLHRNIELTYKYNLTKALLVICYIYLEEWEIANDILDAELDTGRTVRRVGSAMALMLVSLLNLNTWRAVSKVRNGAFIGLNNVDFEEFKMNVKTLLPN